MHQVRPAGDLAAVVCQSVLKVQSSKTKKRKGAID
jgi:hypothetical protein